MKLHQDLMQIILEWAEEHVTSAPVDPPRCCNHDAMVVHYHVGLCSEAGYLNVYKLSGKEEPYPRYAIGHLTWEGQMALAQMREN